MWSSSCRVCAALQPVGDRRLGQRPRQCNECQHQCQWQRQWQRQCQCVPHLLPCPLHARAARSPCSSAGRALPPPRPVPARPKPPISLSAQKNARHTQVSRQCARATHLFNAAVGNPGLALLSLANQLVGACACARLSSFGLLEEGVCLVSELLRFFDELLPEQHGEASAQTVNTNALLKALTGRLSSACWRCQESCPTRRRTHQSCRQTGHCRQRRQAYRVVRVAVGQSGSRFVNVCAKHRGRSQAH